MPYLLHRSLFARLFWFGDEFDLIDQIDRMGFWHWVGKVFAENFVPLFKVLWGGAALLLGGSYGAMIALRWLTHALNVALLGRILRTCGLSWTAVFLAQVLFGLSPANYETLAWSVQWSAVLSVTFMLLAMDSFFRSGTLKAQVTWSACSALSFSRGVLTGPVIALGWMLEGSERASAGFRSKARSAVILILPSAAVAALILALASGNHQHMKGHEMQAAIYGLWYYCANPAHYLLAVESYGWHTVAVLGLLKLVLVSWSLLRSAGRTRVLFAMLVAFELGNAVLLGIGRYHTGLLTTLASRYQYASLLGSAPMVGFWFSSVCGRIPGPKSAGRAVAGIVLFSLSLAMLKDWGPQIEPFTAWRGTQSRQILFQKPNPKSDAVPGIPGLPMERAKALMAKYSLH